MRVPIRYVPRSLTKSDTRKQISELKKSRKLYTRGIYHTRKKLKSFKSRPSGHVANAKRIYRVTRISPSALLAKRTGCSTSALRAIVRKGEGAYFSSGSRPNQTAQSWGIARLASAITGGKSSAVDFSILRDGCSHSGKAYRLSRKGKVTRARTRKV